MESIDDLVLLGWQARSLRTVEGVPRYLTYPPTVKRIIYNTQNLTQGGDTLFITEGPFDAIKIDYYGKPRIRATCTFGATLTPEQIGFLFKFGGIFSKVIIMFDNDDAGLAAGFELRDWLPNAKFGQLDQSHKDTDKLTPDEMRRWLDGIR